MKKRLLALALTIVLALSISIPAFAGIVPSPSWYSGSGTSLVAGAGTAITAGEYFKVKGDTVDYDAYGFLPANNNTKISWKKIEAKDVTKNGYFSLEKLMSKPGTLYFVTGGVPTATGTSVPTGKNAISFTIKERATKLNKTTTPALIYSYTPYGIVKANFATATGLEFTYANMADSWQELDNITNIAVLTFKRDLWVRTAATEEKAASVPFKISVPATKEAPALKYDVSKGTIVLKAGMYVCDTIDGTYVEVTNTNKIAKVNSSPTSMSAAEINVQCNAGTLFYRIPSTDAAKPGTKTGRFSPTAQLNGYVSTGDFFFTVKGLQVTGGKVIEMKIGTGADAKWKKIKSIKNEDLGTITVRVVGDKYILPGPESIITFDKDTGEVS